MMSRLSQNAVLVHLDTDEDATKPISKRYHLGAIPTVIIFDAKGQETDRIIGYDDDRSAWMKTLLASLYGVDTIDDFQARYAAKPSLVTAHKVAQKFLDRGDGTNALVWVDKARGLKPDAKADADLALIQGQAWLITDPPKGTEALMRLATSAEGPEGLEAYGALSAFYKRKARNATSPEEKAKAKADRLEVFHKVIAARPSDPEVLSGFAWYAAAEGIELEQALAAARKAAGLKKDDAETQSVLAEVAFKAGKGPEALEAIDRAIALDGEEASYKDQKTKYSKGLSAK